MHKGFAGGFSSMCAKTVRYAASGADLHAFRPTPSVLDGVGLEAARTFSPVCDNYFLPCCIPIIKKNNLSILVDWVLF